MVLVKEMKKYIMLSLFVASIFAGRDRNTQFLRDFLKHLEQEKRNSEQGSETFKTQIMYDEYSDTNNIELLLQISINKAATQEEVDLQILTSIKAAQDIRKNSVVVKSLKRQDHLYIDYIDAQNGMIFQPQNIVNSLPINFDIDKPDATTIFKLCAGNNCKKRINPDKPRFVKEHYFNCKEDGNVQLCSLKNKGPAKYDEKEPNQAIFDQENNLMFYLHQVKEESPQ